MAHRSGPGAPRARPSSALKRRGTLIRTRFMQGVAWDSYGICGGGCHTLVFLLWLFCASVYRPRALGPYVWLCEAFSSCIRRFHMFGLCLLSFLLEHPLTWGGSPKP